MWRRSFQYIFSISILKPRIDKWSDTKLIYIYYLRSVSLWLCQGSEEEDKDTEKAAAGEKHKPAAGDTSNGESQAPKKKMMMNFVKASDSWIVVQNCLCLQLYIWHSLVMSKQTCFVKRHFSLVDLIKVLYILLSTNPKVYSIGLLVHATISHYSLSELLDIEHYYIHFFCYIFSKNMH